MGFGNPFAMMKNLNGQLSHIHRSIDIRVSLDDEHLAIHFACQFTFKGSLSLHDFDYVWLVTGKY
jgi:UDP:flavonoid glycosyltransferase YjiC (YdhE family)